MPTAWDISTTTSVTINTGTGTSVTTGLELFANDYAPTIFSKIPNGSDLQAAGARDVSIAGMNNPSAVGLGTSVGFQAVLADASPDIVAYGTTANLADCDGIPITTYTITPSVSTLNTLGVDYDFKFTIVSAIPEDGQFAVTFASTYTLSTVVYAELITDLTATSGATVTVTVTSASR